MRALMVIQGQYHTDIGVYFLILYASCEFCKVLAKICLFALILNVPINSCGHVRTSPLCYGTST